MRHNSSGSCAIVTYIFALPARIPINPGFRGEIVHFLRGNQVLILEGRDQQQPVISIAVDGPADDCNHVSIVVILGHASAYFSHEWTMYSAVTRLYTCKNTSNSRNESSTILQVLIAIVLIPRKALNLLSQATMIKTKQMVCHDYYWYLLCFMIIFIKTSLPHGDPLSYYNGQFVIMVMVTNHDSRANSPQEMNNCKRPQHILQWLPVLLAETTAWDQHNHHFQGDMCFQVIKSYT